MSEPKSPYRIAFHVSPAEERLLLRLRQLPAGAHLLTVQTNGNGLQAVTIWSGDGCRMERLEKVDSAPIA